MGREMALGARGVTAVSAILGNLDRDRLVPTCRDMGFRLN